MICHCVHCGNACCSICGRCKGCGVVVCEDCADEHGHSFEPDGENHGGFMRICEQIIEGDD